MGFILACLLMHCAEPPPPERCTLRVTADHLRFDGERMPPQEAIAHCQKRHSAILIVDDDASKKAARDIRDLLEKAGLNVVVRGTLDDRNMRKTPLPKHCLDNPLAKDCL